MVEVRLSLGFSGTEPEAIEGIVRVLLPLNSPFSVCDHYFG